MCCFCVVHKYVTKKHNLSKTNVIMSSHLVYDNRRKTRNFYSCYLDSCVVIDKLIPDCNNLESEKKEDKKRSIEATNYLLDHFYGEYVFISPMVIGEFFQVAMCGYKKTKEETTEMLTNFIKKYQISIISPDLDLTKGLNILPSIPIEEVVLYDEYGNEDCCVTQHNPEGKDSYGSTGASCYMEGEENSNTDKRHTAINIGGALIKLFTLGVVNGRNIDGNITKLQFQDKLILYMAQSQHYPFFITSDKKLLKKFGNTPEDRHCDEIMGLYTPLEFAEELKKSNCEKIKWDDM